jgi:hypothetical protein
MIISGELPKTFSGFTFVLSLDDSRVTTGSHIAVLCLYNLPVPGTWYIVYFDSGNKSGPTYQKPLH